MQRRLSAVRQALQRCQSAITCMSGLMHLSQYPFEIPLVLRHLVRKQLLCGRVAKIGLQRGQDGRGGRDLVMHLRRVMLSITQAAYVKLTSDVLQCCSGRMLLFQSSPVLEILLPWLNVLKQIHIIARLWPANCPLGTAHSHQTCCHRWHHPQHIVINSHINLF